MADLRILHCCFEQSLGFAAFGPYVSYVIYTSGEIKIKRWGPWTGLKYKKGLSRG